MPVSNSSACASSQAAPSVLRRLRAGLARIQHLNPLALGMLWTFGAAAKVFVYQSAPMVVGYSYGCFDARDMFKIGACLTIVESLILILLVPFYWPLIGV